MNRTDVFDSFVDITGQGSFELVNLAIFLEKFLWETENDVNNLI